MRLARVAVCGLLALAARGASAQEPWPPATPEPLRAEVVAELEAYYADFSDRDWDAFREHFWPHATLATVWTPPGADGERVMVTTVDDFVARAPEGPGSRSIFEEKPVASSVTGAGALAQAWVLYEARFGDPGDVTEWSGVDAFTLLRHDGRWRIVSLTYVMAEPP